MIGLFDISRIHINFCGFNLREEGIIYILKEIGCNGMKWTKTLLIIAFSLVVVLLASCSADSSSPSFSVTYLSPDGSVAMIHEVEEGEKDVPPQEGELPENEEFYWSLTEDGDVFDFSTPILGNITLYPIAKSKRVNVEFYYSDGKILTSKLCKVGAKVSVGFLGSTKP